jgi:hypothetical protein
MPNGIQGCQNVWFQTKNPNLGKFWRALDWTILIYFSAIWNILAPFGIFYGHLVQFVFVWYIFSGFGTMCHEKSGNPDGITKSCSWNWSRGFEMPSTKGLISHFNMEGKTVVISFQLKLDDSSQVWNRRFPNNWLKGPKIFKIKNQVSNWNLMF